jgi:ribonuclease R
MIEQSEILRRRDMRDVFTFTIDPADAKDFDDALSFEIINQGEASNKDEVSNLQTGEASNKDEVSNLQTGEAQTDCPAVYQIGVHIADVSFYVRPGTKTDEDAYKRGTSVYLVDRVLPMLPEELCNDKCSLRPNEDKLCMSVIFTMDADARVRKYKICRTVIRSNARLNYDEAQQIIMANQTSETQSRENRIESITRLSRERHEINNRSKAYLYFGAVCAGLPIGRSINN